MSCYRERQRAVRVHPDADVHESAEIGNLPESRDYFADPAAPLYAVVVGSTARVGPFATIDAGTAHATVVNGWVFAHAHVGHDARVEEGAEVSTGAVVGGHARVGRGARVGLNATVLPFKRVGDGAVVGAGAVVTKDVPAGEVWIGNPARKLEKHPDEWAGRELERAGWEEWYAASRAPRNPTVAERRG